MPIVRFDEMEAQGPLDAAPENGGTRPASRVPAATTCASSSQATAPHMFAAVYRGNSMVSVDEVDTPEIGAGEILIRVEACGVCHTDLKKIEYNLLSPPRIYEHETAGVVAHVGADVTKFQPGDRVIVFHHIPCGSCF